MKGDGFGTVEVADREDLKHAVSNALRCANVSFDELAAQARTGQFQSIRARLAWVAVGDLHGVDLDTPTPLGRYWYT